MLVNENTQRKKIELMASELILIELMANELILSIFFSFLLTDYLI